ncbi:hypothetical protein [Longispora albida]|uniref:hypothetical protein n=1 Tax=Longispora albida TaxID=203523 RepID=UPI00058B7BE3|nr:hypothetical protein [Longispora albida]
MAQAAHVNSGSARRLLASAGWIGLITAAVLIGAAAYSWSRTPLYRSAADVLVTISASPNLAPDMGTERTIATSQAVLTQAASRLGVTPEDMGGGLSVTVPVDTTVLRIAATREDPGDAQRRAQAVATAYVAVRNGQKQAQAGATATSAAEVITQAPLPQTPVSPNHAVDLSAALVVGVGIGAVTALARRRLDDRVRSPRQLAELTGAPLLGVIPPFRYRQPAVAGHVPVVHSPGSPPERAYHDLLARLLRVAENQDYWPATPAARGRTGDLELRFGNLGNGAARMILVTSAGREHRNVLAANLAAAIAHSGHQVLLVGADPAQPLDAGLGAVSEAAGLTDVLAGRAGLAETVTATRVLGLRAIPPGAPDDFRTVNDPELGRLLAMLRHEAPYVVIAGPSILDGAYAEVLASHADLVLFLGEERRSRRGDVTQAVARLDEAAPVTGCVLDAGGWHRRLPWISESFWKAPADEMPPVTVIDGVTIRAH